MSDASLLMIWRPRELSMGVFLGNLTFGVMWTRSSFGVALTYDGFWKRVLALSSLSL